MNKIAVIYKSKYGNTKKYAEWIAQKSRAKLFSFKEANIGKLSTYGTIVYGGGLYASSINGVSLITRNFGALKDKNVVIFTVGLATTEDKEIFRPILEKHFTEEMRKKIQFFHLRGGIDYKRLSLLHKAMMAMLRAVIIRKKPEEISEDDQIMLATYGGKVDLTDKRAIDPLVAYITSLD